MPGLTPTQPEGKRELAFRFESYASFLIAYVADRKRSQPSYSYKVLCRAAGLKSPSLVGMVANGQRLPSRVVLRKLNLAMRLSGAESAYLETLVDLERARLPQDQEILRKKLNALGLGHEPKPISLDHFQFISDWYHLVVLEMVNLHDFTEDPHWIAARLGHRVTAEQAGDALARLQRLRLLVRDASGRLRYESNNYLAEAKVADAAVFRFHRQMAEQAFQAIERQSTDERDVGATTMAIDAKRFAEAKEAIREFRTRFVNQFADPAGTEVYQFNLQFFRMTEGP